MLIKNRLDQAGLAAKTQALETVEGGEVVRIEVHTRPHVDKVGDDLGQFTLLISVKNMMVGLKIAVQQLSIKHDRPQDSSPTTVNQNQYVSQTTSINLISYLVNKTM